MRPDRIDTLIENSSLGTAKATLIQSFTDQEVLDEIFVADKGENAASREPSDESVETPPSVGTTGVPPERHKTSELLHISDSVWASMKRLVETLKQRHWHQSVKWIAFGLSELTMFTTLALLLGVPQPALWGVLGAKSAALVLQAFVRGRGTKVEATRQVVSRAPKTCRRHRPSRTMTGLNDGADEVQVQRRSSPSDATAKGRGSDPKSGAG